jgi:hypothetical protein
MMNAQKIRKSVALLAALVMGFGGLVFAQAGGQGGPGGGNFNREDWRKRMQERMQQREQRMREELGMTEDEWEVIGPMINEIQRKQRDAMSGGRRRGFGGPGGGPGGGPNGPEAQPPEGEQEETAADALRKTLENKEAPAAEITEKLAAYRKEIEGKLAEVKAAREELRKVVTQRQEALLVLMGVLD